LVCPGQSFMSVPERKDVVALAWPAFHLLD